MTTRALLAAPLGFPVGVALGALGGGGSILAVPVLVFVGGLTPASATSTSLVVVGVASLLGAYGHWRSGRVRIGAGLTFGLVGIGGSLAGSALNRRLDGDVLLLAFSALILVAAWRIVAGCPSCTRSGEARALGAPVPAGRGIVRTRTWAPVRVMKIALAGTAVGFLTGLFGVGGGFVIVPVLALVLEFPIGAAIGTSLLVVAVNTAVALAARVGGATIDWGTTALFTMAATVGVGVGKQVADRLEPESMQRAFAALLVVLALYTGARSLLGLV